MIRTIRLNHLKVEKNNKPLERLQNRLTNQQVIIITFLELNAANLKFCLGLTLLQNNSLTKKHLLRSTSFQKVVLAVVIMNLKNFRKKIKKQKKSMLSQFINSCRKEEHKKKKTTLKKKWKSKGTWNLYGCKKLNFRKTNKLIWVKTTILLNWLLQS